MSAIIFRNCTINELPFKLDFDPANMCYGGFVKSEKWLRSLRQSDNGIINSGTPTRNTFFKKSSCQKIIICSDVQASMRKSYYKARVCVWKLGENEDLGDRIVEDPIGINPKQRVWMDEVKCSVGRNASDDFVFEETGLLLRIADLNTLLYSEEVDRPICNSRYIVLCRCECVNQARLNLCSHGIFLLRMWFYMSGLEDGGNFKCLFRSYSKTNPLTTKVLFSFPFAPRWNVAKKISLSENLGKLEKMFKSFMKGKVENINMTEIEKIQKLNVIERVKAKYEEDVIPVLQNLPETPIVDEVDSLSESFLLERKNILMKLKVENLNKICLSYAITLAKLKKNAKVDKILERNTNIILSSEELETLKKKCKISASVLKEKYRIGLQNDFGSNPDTQVVPVPLPAQPLPVLPVLQTPIPMLPTPVVPPRPPVISVTTNRQTHRQMVEEEDEDSVDSRKIRLKKLYLTKDSGVIQASENTQLAFCRNKYDCVNSHCTDSHMLEYSLVRQCVWCLGAFHWDNNSEEERCGERIQRPETIDFPSGKGYERLSYYPPEQVFYQCFSCADKNEDENDEEQNEDME